MSGKIVKILKSSPIRMWIDGKCFNLETFNNKIKKSNGNKSQKRNESLEMTTPISNINIFPKDQEGKFYTSFELPKFYYQKLLTEQYSDTIKILSEKTNTKIIIPEVGQDSKLQIVGENEENLQEALSEIHSVIGHIRDSNVPIQFATIPLLSKDIQANFEKFKKEVLADDELENIDASVFFKKEKLHLTINVFVLHDEKELKEATNALNDYKKYYLIPLLKKTGPLKINVEGIDCMNSNYKKVNVLYAKANILGETEEANLQKIADELSWYFYERGLLKRPQESVKIHMTLMNVKFSKGSRKKRTSKRQSFDASTIMEKFKDYKFGTCDFNSIRIAHISANPDKDGFYKTLSEVKLEDCLHEPRIETESINIGDSIDLNLEKQRDCEQDMQYGDIQNLQNPNELADTDKKSSKTMLNSEI